MNKCIVSKNLVKWRFVDRRGRVSFNKIIHMFNSLYGFFNIVTQIYLKKIFTLRFSAVQI